MSHAALHYTPLHIPDQYGADTCWRDTDKVTFEHLLDRGSLSALLAISSAVMYAVCLSVAAWPNLRGRFSKSSTHGLRFSLHLDKRSDIAYRVRKIYTTVLSFR